MSSFPQHVDNIRALERLGFDISESLDDVGDVSYESWNYDELVYLISDIISVLDGHKFRVKSSDRT